jgi:hypothetical protein
MSAGWKTLDTQNNSLTIDLSEEEEEEEEEKKTWTTVKKTTGWVQS